MATGLALGSPKKSFTHEVDSGGTGVGEHFSAEQETKTIDAKKSQG